MKTLWTCLILQLVFSLINAEGILYPRPSETREVMSLDGLWHFTAGNMSNGLEGFKQTWFKKDIRFLDKEVILMPVPASYNDVTTDWKLRDHVGVVWYQRFFFVPRSWGLHQRVWIRFGSVSHAAQVYINGKLAVTHDIGHLPFQKDVTELLKYGAENKITVVCDNTLLPTTIPQGHVVELQSGRLQQGYSFDFFNYGGIDRPVVLYTTPEIYIDDINVTTLGNCHDAQVRYNINVVETGRYENVSCRVVILDREDQTVGSTGLQTSFTGEIKLTETTFWWPYLMSERPGYLYTFQVELLDSKGFLVDRYRLPIGLRTLSWDNGTLYINQKSIYLHGFGRHEDSDIRGKGLDLPLIVRDYNLIKWVGANAYRTSHYPYAEEIMDLADQMGIMIIDESPAVNVDKDFSHKLLTNHKKSLTELIKRDKNRPSVIMWSAANEPRTQYEEAGPYFKEVIDHIKSLDTTRPTTIVESQQAGTTQASKYVDIISFNRYNGWYRNAGDLDIIKNNVIKEARSWHNLYNKPVIMQEYGADTQEGLHFQPTYIWSEEYQVKLMSEHFKAFDELRTENFFIGEFIWNFADFKTAQTYTRVGGNKKGIFTRNRQPKASAHHLRRRYWALAKKYNENAILPNDLDSYTA